MKKASSVYKILSAEQWQQFQYEGLFEGSEHDKRDGFIHLSKKEQVNGVLERYYSNQTEVVIVEISDSTILKQLKWEKASNGELFPHLYQSLKISACGEVEKRQL